jgi:hypothetical protein
VSYVDPAWSLEMILGSLAGFGPEDLASESITCFS